MCRKCSVGTREGSRINERPVIPSPAVPPGQEASQCAGADESMGARSAPMGSGSELGPTAEPKASRVSVRVPESTTGANVEACPFAAVRPGFIVALVKADNLYTELLATIHTLRIPNAAIPRRLKSAAAACIPQAPVRRFVIPLFPCPQALFSSRLVSPA
jgi:hypothetical protein